MQMNLFLSQLRKLSPAENAEDTLKSLPMQWKKRWVAKGEAAKAYKTRTNLEKFRCDQCNYTKFSKLVRVL